MPIRPENADRYPADWEQISHRIRFERAHGHCECDGRCARGHTGRCPVRHRDTNPDGRRLFLTVAHLDHQPENNTEENLMAMCPGCHLHYDVDHHAQTQRERIDRDRRAHGQLEIGWAATHPDHGGDARDFGDIQPRERREDAS